MSNTLSCKNVVKAYGKNEVLHGVNLELEKGKVYGLAEVNVSAANTFGMVGLGVRL